MKLPVVDIGNFAIKCAEVCVREHAYVPDYYEVFVRIETNALNGSGAQTEVVNRHAVAAEMVDRMRHGPALLRDIIREKVRETVLHEIDEWLRIDGKLAVNPHPEVKRDDVWRKR